MGAKLAVDDAGLLRIADASNVTPYFREQVLAQQGEIVVWLRIIEDVRRHHLHCQQPAEGPHGANLAHVDQKTSSDPSAPEGALETGLTAFDFGDT
jgi:hypothetical protein